MHLQWDYMKDPVPMQAFLEGGNVLVSGSKDGYVRAWDLGTQHCFQTVAGQQGEARFLSPPVFCTLSRRAGSSASHAQARCAASAPMGTLVGGPAYLRI